PQPVVRSHAEKAASKANAADKQLQPASGKRYPGRPQGRKTTAKTDATLSPELERIKRMIDAWRPLSAAALSLTYVVLDGHFGNHHALARARQCQSTSAAPSAAFVRATAECRRRAP